MDRRQFLKLVGVGAVAAGPLVYALTKLPPGTLTPQRRSKEFHAIDRLTYGITPDLYATVRKIGAAAFVAQQLKPDAIDDSWVDYYLQPYADDLQSNGGILARTRNRYDVRRMLVEATMVRAHYSERQLYERMVQFWGNHFYVYSGKGRGDFYKVDDDRDVIRPYAFKTFRQLLGASAHSPAMLDFLDNTENSRNRTNENYSREMMELHTLGVNGGYTESDVKEVARCFTGWWINRRIDGRNVGYEFQDRRHDNDAKTVFGAQIPAGGGEQDGETVLDLAAAHPSTARHISQKIARRFVSDSPPEALVERLAATFQQSGSDVAALLTDLFNSDDFWNAPPKLKQPFEYMLNVIRALNVKVDSGSNAMDDLVSRLASMGNIPFDWPAPNGYPDVAVAWQDGVLSRWNFVVDLLNGQLRGITVNFHGLFNLMESEGVAIELESMLGFMGGYLLGRSLSEDERAVVLEFAQNNGDDLPAQFTSGTALLLASPAFQYR